MRARPITTRLFRPRESLEAFLDEQLPCLPERSVVALSAKLVSLSQGRLVARQPGSKASLARQQAQCFCTPEPNPYELELTITEGILIPSSGIDESNAQQAYILYPEDPAGVATRLWRHLRQRHGCKELGVLLNDSRSTPLRRGVSGVGLAWCGFAPLYSYVGKQDLFGRPLRSTHVNVLDALAGCAVLLMGEGAECTPLVLLEQLPRMQFLQYPPTAQQRESIVVPMAQDIYAPLLGQALWQPGGAAA